MHKFACLAITVPTCCGQPVVSTQHNCGQVVVVCAHSPAELSATCAQTPSSTQFEQVCCTAFSTHSNRLSNLLKARLSTLSAGLTITTTNIFKNYK